MKFFNEAILSIKNSARELRSTRAITMISLLIAINIVLGNTLKFYVTPTDKIGIGFLTVATIGNLFGAVPAMMAGMIQDILKWIIRSEGAYFPGFTLSAILGGFFAGLTLYKKEVSIFRCIGERLSISVFINILLNSLWKLIYFGNKHYLAYVSVATVKALILLPFEIIILYIFLTMVIAPIKKQFFKSDCPNISKRR